jgi:radical SAM protein with 4Fe4S-binding SPASM domain
VSRSDRAGSYRHKQSAAELVDLRFGQGLTPLSAMIEVADRCNEACVHCYQVQGQKGEMSTDELRRVMDELSEMGVIFLTISGGEPTLRKDFLELVEHARKRRFAVKIYSNGLRIDEKLANRLGELAVQEVQLSLYSRKPEVHDGVTRVPGSFERTVQAAKHLRAAGVAVVLKSPLMSVNQDDVTAYADWVRSLGADYSMDPNMTAREDGALDPLALDADKEAYFTLQRHPAFSSAQSAASPHALDAAPCRACQGNVHIEANGEVRPCTQWTLPAGDCRSEGVAAAWRENPTAQVVRSLTWGDLPACRECDLESHCSRCFSEAQVHSGNALAPYARACRRALWQYELSTGAAPRVDVAKGATEQLGPYRRLGEHHFEARPMRLSEEDLARLERHPFLLRERHVDRAQSSSPEAGDAAGETTQSPSVGRLVQLRRSRREALTDRGAEPSSSERLAAERGCD